MTLLRRLLVLAKGLHDGPLGITSDASAEDARHPQHDGEQMEGQVMRTGDALSDAHGVLRFGSVLEADHESLDRIGRDLAIALGCQRDCRSAAVQARARDLGLQHVHTGVKDKAATLRMLCASLGLSASETAHMGDDLPDLPALLQVGLSAAPANAHPWIAERVHWQSRLRGGEGAARELCDLILDAKGLRAAVLEQFGAA